MSQVTDGTVKFTVRDSRLNSLLDILYPVGSIKITVSSSAPFSDLGFGTWEEVSKGRVLWGADDSHSAGSTIEAGLPNITGRLEIEPNIIINEASELNGVVSNPSGAFDVEYSNCVRCLGNSEHEYTRYQDNAVLLNASRSSSVYGNSNTVTPPLTSSISGKGSVSPYLREVV